MRGYGDPLYAASLAEFGTPRELALAGGWILLRDIPDSSCQDAAGPYPLFCCERWSNLGPDLEALGDEVVSLSLVADPFGDYDSAALRRIFDEVVPFKEHYVVDCKREGFQPSRHHRYYARWALRRIEVQVCSAPEQLVEEWAGLYDHLVARHSLRGIKAFSRAAFAVQLRIPGLVMLKATHEGHTVGAQLWYVRGEVAFSHLTACTPTGYALRASYALYWSAIEHLAPLVRWLDLGAGPGVNPGGRDGLAQFKRGWATETRSALFCGRILDAERYRALSAASDATAGSYFPAYRQGEFS